MKLDMETKNEEWVEVFKGLIPVDNYRLKVLLTNLSDGQEIRLIGEQNRFKLSCIYYDEAKRLINLLKNILPIPSDEIPRDSIIREFIGGSCYEVQ